MGTLDNRRHTPRPGWCSGEPRSDKQFHTRRIKEGAEESMVKKQKHLSTSPFQYPSESGQRPYSASWPHSLNSAMSPDLNSYPPQTPPPPRLPDYQNQVQHWLCQLPLGTCQLPRDGSGRSFQVRQGGYLSLWECLSLIHPSFLAMVSNKLKRHPSHHPVSQFALA